MDPDRFFNMLAQASGGTDTIKFDNLPPDTKAWLRRMTDQNGLPPLPETGEWNKNQFMEFYVRMDAARQQRQNGGGPGYGPGGGPGYGGPGGPGGRDPNEYVAQRMAELDKNKDGKISWDEADDRLRRNFNEIDTNHDGFVDVEEYRAYMIARMGGGNNNGPRGPDGKPMLPDPNAGGFYDYGPNNPDPRQQEQVALRYGKMPKDAPKWFTDYDLNKDGQIELSEWRAMGGSMKDFALLDEDGDGIITIAECLRAEARKKPNETRSTNPEDVAEGGGDNPPAGDQPRRGGPGPDRTAGGGNAPGGTAGGGNNGGGYNGGGNNNGPRGPNPFREGGNPGGNPGGNGPPRKGRN
jgi:Ca2+-binding EF-hand superfamily protein